jgi:hypothetical protein
LAPIPRWRLCRLSTMLSFGARRVRVHTPGLIAAAVRTHRDDEVLSHGHPPAGANGARCCPVPPGPDSVSSTEESGSAAVQSGRCG